jgi:hypothetical protein
MHVFFAESITCENICEPAAQAVTVALLLVGALYILLAIASIVLFWKARRHAEFAHSPKRWLWYVWFTLLAIPLVVYIAALILP